MSCFYVLNGHLFSSELELDNFLIEKGDYRTKYGDVVFSETTGKLHARTLIDDIRSKAEEKESLMEAWRSRKRIIDEDGKSIELSRPYIGVNKFLSEYEITDPVTGETRKLFPEFRKEEYWSRRYSEWAKGKPENFTKDEIDLFFEGDESKCIKIADRTIQEQNRKKIEEKWESQCLYGDCVHSAMQLLFTQEEDSYIKDLIESGAYSKEKFREELNKIEYDKSDYTKVTFQDLIDDRMFDEIWDKCNTIALEIKNKYGEGADFYPEFKITQNITSGDTTETLFGIIDLLVIDKDGIPHIFDYKTSPKEYSDYAFVKKQAFIYQVATYGRMLQKAGFNIDDTEYSIVPIKFADFQKDDTGKFTFSGLTLRSGNIFETDEITKKVKHNDKINDNLDAIIGTYETPEIVSTDLIKSVHNAMAKWFPQFKETKRYLDEEILQDVEESKFNEETGQWEWKPEGSWGKPIYAKSKTELFKKIKTYREKLPKKLNLITKSVIKGAKEAIELNSVEGITFTDTYYNDETVSPDWFKNTMSRYCSGSWKVREDCDALTELGIICLENELTHQFDFIKLSTRKLKYNHQFANKNAHSLLGTFKSDIFYLSRQKSLMLEGVNGNIELMETMMAINLLQGIFGNRGIVGQVQVMDPLHGVGLGASNKELEYCFNELYKHSKFDEVPNNFLNNKISLATKAYIGKTMLSDILTMANSDNPALITKYSKYKDFDSCKSMLDDAIILEDERKQIKSLEKLAEMLSKGDEELQNSIVKNQTKMSEAHVQLYNQVLLAIAELKGHDFRQLLKDHEKWVLSWAWHDKGLHGTYIDNPGNLQSETLNLLTKLVTEAYQNVRDDMMEPESKIRKLVENLKSKKGFTGLKENTIGNQADLYKNIYKIETDADGVPVDILFKDPDSDSSLSTEEKEFLRYALKIINNNRFNESEAETYRIQKNRKYFRVPLQRGDSSSFASKKGLLKAFRERMSRWIPENALEEVKSKTAEFLDKTDDERDKSSGKLFKMTNSFDKGEGNDRSQYIIDRGVEYFESNLETLLLKHVFAYSMKKNIDGVMPLLKASMIHLTTQGYQLNIEFENDLTYAEEYIRNKIKNESIIDPKYLKYEAVANKVKKAASTMVLALSPVQFFYQTIQGVWNDISLIIRKPDGTEAFSLKNMKNAAKMVYADLFHFGNKPTLTQLVNQQYGVNDMDMNSYVDKIKSDLNGMYNLTNFLFKFAQRPDYYNRMTIFQAKMIADGCMEAHKINNDGMLEYNWKLDKRYDAFANGRKSDPKYQQQAAAYYAVAKQFESEHAKVKINGEFVNFEVNMENPMPLPRAYTNLEAESMKSLSDNIYGYYSHEKKSLIHSTLLGSLWMQFKTFWSGKKNQYLAGGGVRLEGKWKQYEEDGLKYYYQVDPDGTVRYDLEPTTTETNAPVVRWEGQWQEGILATTTNLIKASLNGEAHDMWYNEDENLRNTYRSNMYKLAYDIMMFMIVGSIISAALAGVYKDEKKEADDTFADGLRLAALNIAMKSVSNSFMDFNMIDSIASPATSWTPFSIEYLSKQLKGIATIATQPFKEDGDVTGKAWDFAVKTTSIGKQFKPVFDRIKPSND